ncbi:EAL domain-containing protein [Vibrio sp. TH_r3]|uniref:EAL domain-containing protein n=1 Tax=Vibrio sp. TH_r3 TaxID=3082084 RepID=UPI00295465BE|nr:EAL domain-containing protein [Vibrio sp. TH_r3]MDV7105622.1 EAL domain-containing protein [Vibrio sp. TH_r3]
MYLFGLFLYIGIPVFTYLFEPARALVTQCFILSPEITVLITLTYFYPLSIFSYNFVRKHADAVHLAHFRTQVTLASSLAVSFGLIGTFIGLSEMIAGIAAGMGAEGDFSEKMEALLGSIGSALDSMSFAFLTSIMGVSCSVSVLLASNYLNGFYEKELVHGEKSGSGDSTGSGNTIEGISAEQQQVINENFQSMQKSIDDTIALINSKEKVWLDLYTLLENNSGSTVVQSFSDSLAENNRLAKQQSDQVQMIYNEQASMYQKMENSLAEHSQSVQQQSSAVINVMSNMSDEVDRMGQVIDQTSNNTNQIITDTGDVIVRMNSAFSEVLTSTNSQLSDVATILHDIRLATATPLEEALNVALLDNAFDLVFQPQFDANKVVTGAESYIRWIDPVRGQISNAKLFKIAKDEGLSAQLEFWIMRNTIQQVSLWQKQGNWNDNWTVSINATSELLLAPNFVTEVESALNKNDVQASCIAFEVTEDAIMQHAAQAKDKIRQLHNMGLKLYIDNFGTGYTNIGQLSEFQPDRLKVARDIVNSITDSTQSGVAVVRSVMSLAKQLGITVSADGVETEEQFELLKAEGCQLFQGWHFEKPLQVEEFEQKLNVLNIANNTAASSTDS